MELQNCPKFSQKGHTDIYLYQYCSLNNNDNNIGCID